MLLSLFILVVILVFCCYFPVLFAFHDRERSLTPAHALLYMAVGMGILGISGIFCRLIGVDVRFGVLPGSIVFLCGFRKYRSSLFPRANFSGLKSPGAIFAVFASAVAFLFIFIAGIRMGTGSYPQVFFCVDTPFYLGQIHAILRYDTWPPLSLSFLGGMRGYHYGTQAVCATISALTGIAPHTVTFLIFMPVIQLAIISAVWLIMGSLKGNSTSANHWLGIPFILFSNSFPMYQVLKPLYRLFWQSGHPSVLQAFYSSLAVFHDPETLNSAYPMLSSHFGLLLALGCIYCLLNNSVKSYRLFLATMVGISIIFKSPFFTALFLGFGAWTLYDIIKCRRLLFLKPLLISLAVSISLYLIARPGVSWSWVFIPDQFFLGSKQRIVDTLGTFWIYAFPAILMAVLLRGKKISLEHIVLPAVFLTPLFLFLQLFGLERAGQLTGNIYQVLFILPVILAVFSMSAITANWHNLNKLSRYAAILAVILITIPSLGHSLVHTGFFIVAPEKGHEYTDNHLLAEALIHIPVSGSIILTNDFRYPADNFKRDFKQMQFPALYGHQMYASNFSYERYDESDQRLALQYRFRKENWDPLLEEIAIQEGWTHLVIHRQSPHTQNIPLTLLFENSDYIVYKFN